MQLYRQPFPPRITGDHQASLVQGGLETACKVSAKMPGTVKNHLMDRYFELVRSFYTKPKNEVILGLFLCRCTMHTKKQCQKGKSEDPCTCKKTKANRDIRTMFQHMKSKNNETNIGSTIVIDP